MADCLTAPWHYHEGQWRGALMFSLICVWINGWGWWFETLPRALWRHCDGSITPTLVMVYHWWIPCETLVLPAAARTRGQSNDFNREILASNLFNFCKEVINAPPVPSISRCIHIVYQHKNVWEYQWSNFIYNCMSTFLHYVHCKDALLGCSAPGGERCESLTRADEITPWLPGCIHNKLNYKA